MDVRGRITLGIAAIGFSVSGHARACHETVHYTKAQVDAANIRLYERNVSRARAISRVSTGNMGGSARCSGASSTTSRSWTTGNHIRSDSNASTTASARMIDGDRLFHKKHPFDPTISGVPLSLLDPSVSVPTRPGPHHGGDPSRPADPTYAVPEPSTGVLGFTAVVVGIFAAMRRTQRRISANTAGVRPEVL